MDIRQVDLRDYVRAERLERLCGDLSRLLNLDIEVFNNRGEKLFETTRNRPSCMGMPGDGAACCASFEETARRTVESREGGMERCPGGFTTFRAPIQRLPAVFGAVVACQVVSEDAPWRRSISGGGSDEARDAEILDCLENIAAFIADDCYQRVEIGNLTEELSHRYEELSLIYEIGRNIKPNQTIETTIEFLTNQIKYVLDPTACLFQTDAASFLRVGDGTAESEALSSSDRSAMEILAEAGRKRVIASRHPEVINSLSMRLPGFRTDEKYDGMLSVPVQTESKLHCVLHVFRPRGADFMSGDVKLMEALAQEAAIMIENAELFQDLELLFLNTLKMLVKMIEARDEYTRGHSERVHKFSMAMGRGLGLSHDELIDLNWGSLLHDFGKVRVPDAIIKKPARLDPDEWAIMRRHPVDGAELLRPIPQLAGAIAGVELHHERWDGKGYPQRLEGEAIPFQARIVAIADTYDALTSKRPYHEPMSHDDAIAEIARNAGTQFDPELARFLVDQFPTDWEEQEVDDGEFMRLRKAA